MAIIEQLPPPITTTATRAEPNQRARRFSITLEQALYIGLFVLALCLRLYALGDRAMHHDETHHANFSWLLYQGRGYIHDPLLHGPFLYHLGALLFFLFGDSNFTARLGTALFGSVLVVLPYLLRNHMGRSAALIASVYLLLSPTVLYVNRFIRHDSYAVVFELLTLIALVRYATTRQARWLYLGAAALAFMLTNMATFFLYVAIFLPLVVVLFLWRVWRPGIILAALVGIVAVAALFVLPGTPTGSGTTLVDARIFLYYLALIVFLTIGGPFIVLSIRRRAWSRALLGVALVGGALLALVVLPHQPVEKSGGTVQRANGAYICPSAAEPNPPDNPIVAAPGPLFGFPPLPTEDNNYALCVRNQYDSNFGVYFTKLGQFFGHPAILLGVGVGLVLLVALYWLIWRRRDDMGTTPWMRARLRPDELLDAFASLATGWRWLIAFGLFFVIYALLFSAFFTNPTGVVSGTTGSFLYWLAQHDVQRGGQPDYYYLLTLGIYEPLLLLWGVIGLAMFGTLVARRLLNPPPPTGRIDWDFAMPLLLVWWAVGTFALYSWAGEKMPWLTIRSAVPLTFLAAWAFARAIGWWRNATLSDPWPAELPLDAAPVAEDAALDGDGNGASVALAAAADDIPADVSPTKPRATGLLLYLGIFGVILILCFILLAMTTQPTSGMLQFTIVAPLLAIVLVLLLTAGAWLLRGWRWAVGALAIAVTVFGMVGTARAAYQLNYLWGDVPRELLIYTQTSPDVERVVDRLAQASIIRGGAMDMPVWYDNETVWSWYMRRFTAGKQQGQQLAAPPDDKVMAVLMMDENYNNPTNRQYLDGFVIQRYPLRWWFPEDQTYRLPSNWRTAPVDDNSPLLMRILRNPLDSRTMAQLWQFLAYRKLPAPLGSTDFVVAVRPELADEIGQGLGSDK